MSKQRRILIMGFKDQAMNGHTDMEVPTDPSYGPKVISRCLTEYLVEMKSPYCYIVLGNGALVTVTCGQDIRPISEMVCKMLERVS